MPEFSPEIISFKFTTMKKSSFGNYTSDELIIIKAPSIIKICA